MITFSDKNTVFIDDLEYLFESIIQQLNLIGVDSVKDLSVSMTIQDFDGKELVLVNKQTKEMVSQIESKDLFNNFGSQVVDSEEE